MNASKRLRCFAVVIVTAVVLFASPAPVSAGSCPAAAQLIERAGGDGVAALAAGSMQRFRAIFRRNADMRRIAQFALGRYSRRLKGSERRQYFRLAQSYVLDTLLEPLSAVRPARLEVNGCQKTGGEALVNSTLVLKGGRTYPVKWRVRGSKVVDISVFGIWLAIQHRTKFAGIMSANRDDATALLAYLRGEPVRGAGKGSINRANNR